MNCYDFVREEARVRFGMDLPRLGALHRQVVEVSDPRAGDLVAIRKGRNISHVGLMIDDRRMIHYGKDDGVIITPVSSSLVSRKIEGFYRWVP